MNENTKLTSTDREGGEGGGDMQADDGDISSSLCLVPTPLPASEAVKPLLSTTSRWWSGALERLPIYNNINMEQNIQSSQSEANFSPYLT